MNTLPYLASPNDGVEILRVLESSAAKGSIELIYTRRPDAYASYMKESGDTTVFASKKDGKVTGTCAEIVRNVYVNGERVKCAYICGLKKDATYEGNVGFGPQFIRSLQRDDIDFYYCSVVSDNTDAQKMFSRARRLVEINQMEKYTTYIFSPKVNLHPKENSSLSFRRAEKTDVPDLLRFINREGKRKDLFPVVDSFDDLCGLEYSDFFLLLCGNEIKACAALWNQTEYKQYVVRNYRGIMRVARAFNPLLSLLGYIKLPAKNIPLSVQMLSFILCENDSEELLRILLHKVKAEAPNNSILVTGAARSSFMTPALSNIRSISFDTVLCSVRFPWSDKTLVNVNPKKLHPECGML